MTSEELAKSRAASAPPAERAASRYAADPAGAAAAAGIATPAGNTNPDQSASANGNATPDEGSRHGHGDDPGDPDPRAARERERVDLTDPKAMRALAHPVRWALLEALAHAGTLTATQASEMLNESPANCAFHLRTLAKYGFVEEAGGGKGRERPWRRTYDTLSWGRRPDDPGATVAAEALDQVWIDRLLSRARRSLTSTGSWPRDLDNALGTSSSRLYVTPAEARRLYAQISEAFSELADDPDIAARRLPGHRPADAIPIEFVLLGYPVLDSPMLPDPDADEAAGTDDAHVGEIAAGRAADGRPEAPEMSDPRDTIGRAR